MTQRKNPAPAPTDARTPRRGERRLTLRERRRQWLPYGMWTCADGREVLFNRDYKPTMERRPGQATHRANQFEWVPWVKQQWLFDDSWPPIWDDTPAAARNRAPIRQALTDFLMGAEVTGFKAVGVKW